MRIVVALMFSVFVIACVASRPMPETAQPRKVWLDDSRYLGEPIVVDNLTVWPVHSTRPVDAGAVQTLREAQKSGEAAVLELDAARTLLKNGTLKGLDTDVLAAAGDAQVDTLAVVNHSDQRLLACAGTLVRGGKQDRQFGEDTVVAAQSVALVKAFCVERGRWSADRRGEATEGIFDVVLCFADTDVRSAGQYADSQSKVWDNVDDLWASVLRRAHEKRSALQPSTSGVDAAAAADHTAGKQRDAVTGKLLAHFEELGDEDPAVGFAYAIDGQTVAVRTFADPKLLSAQLPAFAVTMAREAELHLGERIAARRHRRAYIRDFDVQVAQGSVVAEATFLRDVGVDFRGVGEGRGEPLAVLDDVTAGLDDNASASLGNRGPGFFNDSFDGDFRGRTANEFSAQWREVMERLELDAIPRNRPPITFPKDWMARQQQKAKKSDPATAADVARFVRELNRSREKRTAARADNTLGHKRTQKGAHSSCYVTKDGKEIALTQDWTAR